MTLIKQYHIAKILSSWMYFKLVFTDYMERMIGRSIAFNFILVEQISKEMQCCSFKVLWWKMSVQGWMQYENILTKF